MKRDVGGSGNVLRQSPGCWV